jgi:hypothetical protein
MELHYLVFDFSDEESGRGSFDAMASVAAGRLPALRGEIDSVLEWAHRTFGPATQSHDEGDWGYELQEEAEPDARTTLTLTLVGSPAFCEAFRQEFNVDE